MPTLNQHEYIAEAIDSVYGEVTAMVVVDDGSDPPLDGDAVERGRVGLTVWPASTNMWHPDRLTEARVNRGTAAAINAGIAIGDLLPNIDWLTWVSSDNIYRPGWVKALLDATDADTGAVYGGFTWQKPGGRGRYLFTPYAPDRLIQQEDCYYGPAFLIRREVWMEAGPHRGKISHDYDHWLRVEEACWKLGKKIVGVDKDLCWYRAHDKRVTITRRHEYDAKHWQEEGKKRRGIA